MPSSMASGGMVSGGPNLINSRPVWTSRMPLCSARSQTRLAVSPSGAPVIGSREDQGRQHALPGHVRDPCRMLRLQRAQARQHQLAVPRRGADQVAIDDLVESGEPGRAGQRVRRMRAAHRANLRQIEAAAHGRARLPAACSS